MDSAKIMVVDETQSGPALMKLLGGHGYATVSAPDGEAMLRIVAGAAPDLIIMNVHLAGQNGYEITRELRDRGLADGVPVILLTSAQTDGAFYAQREWGVKAGADEVMAKPVHEDTLIGKIRALLAGASPDTHGAPATPARAATSGSGLSERALADLEQRLAQYIGPISKMLVRKVESEVSTTTELYRRLADHIADRNERERFISWTVTQG